jgi:phosphatidate cytidylyltransferase
VSAGEQTLLLFSGIAAVLVAASLIGFVLTLRYAQSPVVGNLNTRIKAWWVMVVLIGFAFEAGKAGVITLFAIASFAALREFLTLTRTRRGDHLALAAAFFVVLPLQ